MDFRQDSTKKSFTLVKVGTLQTTFIVLKLVKVIGWSWWWVLAPTWIPACLGVLGLLLLNIVVSNIDKR